MKQCFAGIVGESFLESQAQLSEVSSGLGDQVWSDSHTNETRASFGSESWIC